MTTESYLSNQLQKLSLLDLSFVKAVYFIFGLLLFTLYPKLALLDWWFYLMLGLISWLPLLVHFLSQSGGLLQKAHAYLKTNNPCNQVLLFLSTFFFALMISTLFPSIANVSWWIYAGLMVLCSIKPLTQTWFW